uniref:Collagen alpha-1(I) chain-like n=1 Tax=Castor canadensis TaxID=51338 RepID=A0A8B7TNR1_CASCN|nr:collagen alpha-1(I) chain-like [Castor canadensis]
MTAVPFSLYFFMPSMRNNLSRKGFEIQALTRSGRIATRHRGGGERALSPGFRGGVGRGGARTRGAGGDRGAGGRGSGRSALAWWVRAGPAPPRPPAQVPRSALLGALSRLRRPRPRPRCARAAAAAAAGGRRGARSCSAAGSLQRARRTGQESPRSAARPPRAPRRRGARGPVAGAHGRPARRTLVGQRRVPLAPAPPAAAGSSGPWPLRLSLGAPGRTLPLPMGIREFPGGSPRGKSIAIGMRSPDVSPRRLSDISPQLRQLKYLVVDEAIKEDLKWSRSVEDLTSGPAGLTSIEERILRITGYYGYQPWAASYKSKTPHLPAPTTFPCPPGHPCHCQGSLGSAQPRSSARFRLLAGLQLW